MTWMANVCIKRIRWRWLLSRFLVVLILLWVLGDVIWVVLSFHPPRLPLQRSPADLGLRYEEANFVTEDGVRITAWFIPADEANDTHCTVIVCHGYPGNRSRFIDIAPALHRAGFSVLMFDFRGNGESTGRPTIGRREVNDLDSATKWLRESKPNSSRSIGVIGFSMGGAVAIMAAARNEAIKAVVSDSAYASLDRPAELTLKRTFGFLAPILGVPARITFRFMLGCDPKDVAPYRLVHLISPRAVFIIHGDADTKVSVEDAKLLYESARHPKELWIGHGVGHVKMFVRHRDEYERRVVSFFKRYIVVK